MGIAIGVRGLQSVSDYTAHVNALPRRRRLPTHLSR
jgi:hypothetical protein